MILLSKRQQISPKYSGFFSSANAYATRKQLSLRDKLSIINAEIKSIVGANSAILLTTLMNLLSSDKPNIMIARSELAKKISVSERTISRCVAILKSFGLIHVISYKQYDNMNAPNIYSVTKSFYAKIDEMSWHVKARAALQNALKAANGGRDNLATINIDGGFPQKACEQIKQNSVGNFQLGHDIPIPSF